MLVETVDQVTLSATELRDAIVERVHKQSGVKFHKASIELVFDDAASPIVKVEATHHVRGARVTGVAMREQPEPIDVGMPCAEG